jgi:MarR family transcriptional regulator, organic hydroperoxide resistance regulator
MKPDTTAPVEARPLSEYLCFAVYSANLAFGRAYKPTLESLGLTYTQYIALVAIHEAGNLTVGSLGEKLFLESNTLTPLLKKLEAMGHVQRQRDSTDERLVRVSLTDTGRRVQAKATQDNSCLVAATGLPPDEFTELQEAVATLRGSLIQATSSGH